VPLIAECTPQLPSAVTALAEEALVEIARFDAELGAEAALFAPALLRAESTASSAIESLTAGAKAIALAELGSRATPNATEIVGNISATTAALELAERLDADAILAMHTALAGELHRQIAGRWREEQVWIGGTSFGPHEADFIPPHHEHVPGLIDDFVAFIQRTDLPLLALAAVAHAQFETIHPFPDANGRTGRALIHSMLRGHGLTQNVTVPVSAGLLADTTTYFASLTTYREGDPSAIVERLATASFEATAKGRQLVTELRAIRAGWREKVTARRDSAAWRVADLLLRQPVIGATVVAGALGIEPRNVQRAITPLTEAGVLTEFTGFRRNRMWQSREVQTALGAFAARAGGRSPL
jgi:Fic family protein